ncbi:heptaprenyl diphosphate synthase [Sedimentibacter acidaminivorans]|jgi:geranylgeranyl pyrophosphate synthase|uniref:Heptaprenyl diphosphate synthase n=1 Tax=Sedimentibacter acidaminivorans TaxID=913099 RepID=A0ABS4GFS5_9FIRM|nr:polyprenyl synthetase family protein [Sedimentibacter acidaminivorans]MBP1926543.1 heptaprenyl diphosphate synthase [Sedimentibacter acidaminivorans]
MTNKDIKTKENIDNVKLIKYDDAIKLVKKEVDSVLSSSPRVIRGYTEHLMGSNGKFIRAISLIACAEDIDGLVHPNAIKFAASIELLHLATLVHDDIIDNANLRRGSVTLQKKYGKRTAVICGDYLLAVSLKLAASINNKEDYLELDMPDYITKICVGELSQHINNYNLDLSVYRYLKIISGKTAALFEASFYAGAVLCETDKVKINKYKELGRYIGMIFQLTDDCMDFETTEDVAKKPVQSDYEQGVVTLPLIYTFKNMLGFKEKARNKEVTRDDINKAVVKSGGLNYTHLLSKKYYNKALGLINELEITPSKKGRLIAILNKSFRVL